MMPCPTDKRFSHFMEAMWKCDLNSIAERVPTGQNTNRGLE